MTLPSLVTRIGNGELVNVESEMTPLEYGSDEIGQVAEAFSTAQRTAVAAAVAEARTRGGINKVFLDIAHRSQLVVYRQLELLDVAEARQGDPEHLELLFQLDHLATRARRNAENLLILGGGQPGRKWRQRGLEDIVRSAVSETEQFARVSTVRLPEVQVLGAAWATSFTCWPSWSTTRRRSRHRSRRCGWRQLVGKGVVVEVEDQGLGIEFAERERLSAALRDPPDFQSMAVSGQRHLGLFVVGQLAQRHGITVSLLESAYGGIKAIVLIPSSVVASAPADDWPELSQAGRYQQQLPLACRQNQPRRAVRRPGPRPVDPVARNRRSGPPVIVRRTRPGEAVRRCLAASGWRTSPRDYGRAPRPRAATRPGARPAARKRPTAPCRLFSGGRASGVTPQVRTTDEREWPGDERRCDGRGRWERAELAA